MQSLNKFLIDEAIKSCANPSFSSSANPHGSSKTEMVNLRSHVFLLNNLEYLLEMSKDLNLIPLFNLYNKNSFDTLIVGSIRKNCEKVCELFQEVFVKWQALQRAYGLNAINVDHITDGNLNETFRLNRAFSITPSDDIKFVNTNLTAPTLMAKKAMNIFKSTMLKQKNTSGEYFSDKNQTSNLNLVKVTNYSRASVVSALDNESGRKNVAELKLKQSKLIQQLLSSIELSVKVVIINPNLNDQIKKTVRKYLGPVIDSFETVDEIVEIFGRLFHHIQTLATKNEITDHIFDEMFPNYKL
jgi:hypothetical protein